MENPANLHRQQPETFNYREFCKRFMSVLPFNFGQLLEAGAREFQVAGHSGFLTSEPSHCLKPFNPKCARGRREYLFYQLVKYFEKYDGTKPSEKLYYKHFPLLINPNKLCDCTIDPETFRSIKPLIPDFKHVKHLTMEGDDFETNKVRKHQYYDILHSDNPFCPCYGNDKRAKIDCSSEYEQENYICLHDLHAHCVEPCILDIKMGRITYDPLATQHKIEEQTLKYPRLRDFGFRILGLRTNTETKGKEFGKSLESQEQVFEAIESFFGPLQTCERKVVVIGRMLDILERLLEWFETKNNNQLRFFASSLLFVYDCQTGPNFTLERLKASVRVGMIDFAHVFHSHDVPEGPSRSGSGTSIFTSGKLNKDDNYLYGLRRLVKFFIMLNRQHRVRLQQQQKQ